MQLFSFLKKNKTVQTLASNVAQVKSKERFTKRINIQKPFRVEAEMKNLRDAVDIANNSIMPDRRPLYGVYEIVIKDSHLKSQLLTAHNAIQQSEFKIVNESGTELKDKLKLFEKSWFTDFVYFAVDSELYGHSLIELALKDEKNEFSQCDLVPRFHVNPSTGEVIIDYSANIKIDYRNNLKALGLIEIGNKDNLGLLEIAAREVIWKTYSRTDWSQHSEKFGMPLLSIETETVDNKELDAIEDMATNFGSNGYVIMNKGDKASIVPQTSSSGNAHAIYHDNIKLCNEEISKLINGQTMTADNGSSLAQAEVHERILNSFTLSRLARIQRETNDKLIPFLIENGYPLQGCKFQYKDLEKRDSKQTQPSPPANTDNQKKKSNNELSILGQDIEFIYENFSDGIGLANIFGIDFSIFNAVISKLYKLAKKDNLPESNQLVKSGIKLITATFNQLKTGMDEGFKLAKYEPDKIFLKKLKDGLWTFSACKTDIQLKEVSALLFDENGDLKVWNRFRDDVLSIHEKYNKNYLFAEYNFTVSSSQMAAKWKSFDTNTEKYYLQYRTVGDERVREKHSILNRVTLPMDDPFWNSYFPPNGWGCRCNVVQVLKSQYAASNSADALKWGEESLSVKNQDGSVNEKATKANQIFKFNPGKSEAIFPMGHPYYDVERDVLKALEK